MTSIRGLYFVKAPCCGQTYAKVSYSSINMMGWERWTDGMEGGRLYQPNSSLCYCKCGSVFAAKDALDSDEATERSNDDVEYLPFLNTNHAFHLIQTGADLPTGAAECEIRLKAWQACNGKERQLIETANGQDDGIFGDYFRKRLGLGDIPPEAWECVSGAELLRLREENLSKLIPLLHIWSESNHLLIGNAYRAQGNIDKALEQFALVTGELRHVMQHLVEMAKTGVTKLIRIEPPDWREPLAMPEPWVNTNPGKNAITLMSKWFWFKIFGMVNQIWALMEFQVNKEEVMIYWIDDNANIIEAREYPTEEEAYDFLLKDGYQLFENVPDVWETLCPPDGPYNLLGPLSE